MTTDPNTIQDDRKLLLTTAATITPRSAITTDATTIRAAVRSVLPDEWRILPDGRSTAATIAALLASGATR